MFIVNIISVNVIKLASQASSTDYHVNMAE